MAMESDHSAVQLPSRMQTDDLLGVGDQLRARYLAATSPARKGGDLRPEGVPEGVHVPASIAASWKRFDAAHVALGAYVLQREASVLNAAPTDDASAVANDASDRAWRAFAAWLEAWAQHDEDGKAPGSADAMALRARLFPAPHGLRFIAWRPRKQWMAMQARMVTLGEDAVVEVVKGLGGARLLAALDRTHRAFGRAYGFTAAQATEAAEETDARPLWTAAREALRDYVKKVEGHADPDVPGSEALAAWLLAPFTEMVRDFAAQATPRAKTEPQPAPVATPR